jgi:hypothetical protein
MELGTDAQRLLRRVKTGSGLGVVLLKFVLCALLSAFAWILIPTEAHAEDSHSNRFDGMSAIDIAVAAALEKQKHTPESQINAADNVSGSPSSISFAACEIVELKGRFMHEGWYPIPGHPLPGTAVAKAVLLGPWQSAEFRLVDETDQLLGAITLALDEEAPDGMTFLGSFEVPEQPFRFAVSGTDASDELYDVVCSKTYQPQTLEVRFDELFVLAEPGLVPLELNITNHGPAGTFNLSVEDDMGVGASLDDSQLVIGEEETATTTVHLDVPNISVGVLDIVVTATVIRHGESDQGNFGTSQVRVQKFNLIHIDSFEVAQ